MFSELNPLMVILVVLAALAVAVFLYLRSHKQLLAAAHKKVDELRTDIKNASDVSAVRRGVDELHKRWDKDDKEQEKRDREEGRASRKR